MSKYIKAMNMIDAKQFRISPVEPVSLNARVHVTEEQEQKILSKIFMVRAGGIVALLLIGTVLIMQEINVQSYKGQMAALQIQNEKQAMALNSINTKLANQKRITDEQINKSIVSFKKDLDKKIAVVNDESAKKISKANLLIARQDTMINEMKSQYEGLRAQVRDLQKLTEQLQSAPMDRK